MAQRLEEHGGRRDVRAGGESALRTSWLKLRGYLFDPVTRLPSLPAVLDDVRRRIEEDEPMGLLYMDLSNGGHSELACGWQTYDELIRAASETLVRCRRELLDERDPLAQVGVRSDEFVLFVGLDGEGESAAKRAGRSQRLDRLETLHREVVERVEAGLRTELDGDATHLPALQSAVVAIHADPTLRIERAIYGTLSQAREICRRESQRRQSGRARELHRMLEAGDVTSRFQPIVDLGSGEVHGWEVLSAAPRGEAFESPEMLFAFAEESDSIVELERLCRRRALARIGRNAARQRRCKLFLNCSAHAFADPELVPDLLASAAEAGFAPEGVVLEVTERVAITEWRSFRRALERVRDAGLQVAIDDMGSGYSSLHAVGEIQPEYLKFDLSLIHGIHESRIKRDLFEALVSVAEKIGACAIAEGIERREEFDAVRRMGVRLGQGYFFARPAPAEELGEIHFPE